MTAAPPTSPARQWVVEGSAVFLDLARAMPESAMRSATHLTGWTRGHVVAHVASNAEALGRLAVWAETGVETPMYPSHAARAADIERGAHLPCVELLEWAADSVAMLQRRLDALSPQAWQATVTTITSRSLPATALPWLRAREVWVHSVDIADGDLGFDALPTDFVDALLVDVLERRSSSQPGPAVELTIVESGRTLQIPGSGTPRHVSGPVAALVAWLTGRSAGAELETDSELPHLPEWL